MAHSIKLIATAAKAKATASCDSLAGTVSRRSSDILEILLVSAHVVRGFEKTGQYPRPSCEPRRDDSRA